MADDFYLYFRQSCIRLQHRFQSEGAVRVFLHGNPHVDNYGRNSFGEGMIDFDRSRIGPYTWDLARFLASIALRRQNSEEGLLSNEIVEQFLDAYRDSFREPSLANQTRAAQVIPENEQALLSTDRYLRQNQKWAKKMRERPLFPSHPSVVEMTRLFFEARSDEDLLSHFEIREAGLASGTLGKMRLLVALAKKDQPQEKLLIEIKEVYADSDHGLFFNPYQHHGMRMIAASDLHAPGVEKFLSFLTWRGKQYWGRQIPPYKAKLKGQLSDEVLMALCHSVATQLGRAHRQSIQMAAPERLLAHFEAHRKQILEQAYTMNDFLRVEWEAKKPSIYEAAQLSSQLRQARSELNRALR